MTKMNVPRCSRCKEKTKMKKGRALQDVYGGIPDFIGCSSNIVTMSPTGQVKIISVWKCPKCGESRSL